MLQSPTKRAKKGFRLRDHVQGADFKLLVTMPAEDFLARIQLLDEEYSKDVLHCIRNIYSYVAERKYVEGTDTFFHHVASAVLYEAAQGELIKGRDHSKKAASIVKMIANTLMRHAEYVPEDDDDLTLVEQVEGLLIHHGTLIESAIKLKDQETLDHLAVHSQYHCDSMAEWGLDKSDRQRNRSGIHTEKTPTKTPKRLTTPAFRAVRSLRDSATESPNAKRKINFLEEEAIAIHHCLDSQDALCSAEEERDILAISNPLLFSQEAFDMGSMSEALPNISQEPSSLDTSLSQRGRHSNSF